MGIYSRITVTEAGARERPLFVVLPQQLGPVDVDRLCPHWSLKKVHQKVRNHREGPYQGLLLVESGYYH